MGAIRLPKGNHEYAELVINDANVSGVYTLNDTAPMRDLEKTLSELLTSPIGMSSLAESVCGVESVLIVCDDNTRRTPAKAILPILLSALNEAGIPDKDITILFAAGTHRAMTEREIEEKIGAEICRRLRFHNHDHKGEMRYKGNTPLGTPIYLNPLADRADFIIGIGSIIPHRYCGWSGGGKIIQPGVCGEETIAETHLLIAKDRTVNLGSVNNVARDEINRVAETAGLKMIINTVLNNAGDPVAIVAGHPVAAHEAGVEVAREVCGVKMERTDVVLIGAWPEDQNLWQAGKSLYTADLAVKSGGTILLYASMAEGIGEHEDENPPSGKTSDEILQMINAREIEDRIGGAAAYAMRLVLDRSKVIIVSENLKERERTFMGMTWMKDLQAAVDRTLETMPEATVNVICNGPEILPLT
ncbi:MAG: nickel-dependent lactate racemase [Clostridiales Family XIII bacterium]|nr:nickel-dependent lactate racemase [Clostridiales Family XIII bacterium]